MPLEQENLKPTKKLSYLAHPSHGKLSAKMHTSQIPCINKYTTPSYAEFKNKLQEKGRISYEALVNMIAEVPQQPNTSAPKFLNNRLNKGFSDLRTQCYIDVEQIMEPVIASVQKDENVNETTFQSVFQNALSVIETYKRTVFLCETIQEAYNKNRFTSPNATTPGEHKNFFRNAVNGTMRSANNQTLAPNIQEMATQLFSLCVNTTPDGGTHLREILSKLKPVFHAPTFAENNGPQLYAVLRDTEKELSQLIHPINSYTLHPTTYKEKAMNEEFLQEFAGINYVKKLVDQHASLVAQFSILIGTQNPLLPTILQNPSLKDFYAKHVDNRLSNLDINEAYNNVQKHANYLKAFTTFYANMYKVHQDSSFADVFVTSKDQMLQYITTKQLEFVPNALEPEKTAPLELNPLNHVSLMKKQSGGFLSKLFKKDKDSYLDDAGEFIALFEELQKKQPDQTPDEVYAKATELFLKSKKVDAQTIANVTSQLQQTAGIER